MIPQKGVYYICSKVINNVVILISQKETTEWTLKKMENIIGLDDFNCINLIGSDTCNKMRNLKNKIKCNLYTKHVFLVLCDSHRLQFLIKDIIETNWFVFCFNSAQNIVICFYHLSTQLAMLERKWEMFIEKLKHLSYQFSLSGELKSI